VTGDLTDWGDEGWRRAFLNALPFVNDPHTQKNLGFAVGQNIYTPEDTERVIPDPKERPYAGWSYLEFSFVSKTAHVMDTVAIQLGIIGPASQAEDTQRIVHELIDDKVPRGWDYQLRNEPGINLIFERKWRFDKRSSGRVLGVDFVPHIGVSLGNVQTYANAGGLVRAGLNLPSDFGIDLIRGGGAVSTPVNGDDPRLSVDGGWSFFVFAGVDGRAVARDIFLDGNTFRESRSVDKKPFVGDGFYGVGAILGTWQLTYKQVLRTCEFEEQDDNTYFGSVALSKAF
jgi:hypothetical protein